MKRIIGLLLIFSMCIGLTGCGPTYEDTNGDDVFTLQTITDDDIIHLRTGASGLNYTKENIGEIIYSSEYSSKNFNGVEQIYLTNCILPSDVWVYIGHLSVTKGNFKLAVVNNDKIIHTFDLDTFGEEIRFENIKGSFSIHVAGESAAFSFHISVY